MKFPIDVKREQIIFSASTTGIAAGATVFLLSTDQDGVNLTATSAVETIARFNYVVVKAGLLKNLVVRIRSFPGVGKSIIFTVRINGVNTSLTATISGAVTTGGNDLINSVRVAIGDLVTLQVVNGVGAAANYATASLEHATNTVRPRSNRISWNASSMPANSTRYFSFNFRGSNLTGDAGLGDPAQLFTVSRKCTAQNLVVLSSSPPGLGESWVYTFGSLTVTISGNVQFTGLDIVNRRRLNLGDGVSLRCVSSAGAVVTSHVAVIEVDEGEYIEANIP